MRNTFGIQHYSRKKKKKKSCFSKVGKVIVLHSMANVLMLLENRHFIGYNIYTLWKLACIYFSFPLEISWEFCKIKKCKI